MKRKVISVTPSQERYEKIEAVAKKLRTSRAGFCELSVEFILDQFEKGKMEFVNGTFMPARRVDSQAA